MTDATVQWLAGDVVSELRRRQPPGSLLVAVSGIDGSGKTTLSVRLAAALEALGVRTALIHLDPWHTPPSVRFAAEDPGGHFYANAFRFRELFERLVNPLRRARSLHLCIDLTRLPENDLVTRTYDFEGVDVIVLEGIFLLKRELAARYDLAYWIECPFETALRRALARNQEGEEEEALRRDYETIYFPAQRIHLDNDHPHAAARAVIDNGSGGVDEPGPCQEPVGMWPRSSA
jgi:uridine kinase